MTKKRQFLYMVILLIIISVFSCSAFRAYSKKVDHNDKYTIVAFGDSVTLGATTCGVLDHDHVYHVVLKRKLEQSHTGTVYNVINAGVGGDTVCKGLRRIDRDVLCYHPDLVIIEFGLNDAVEDNIDRFRKKLQKIINKIPCDMILVTPNFMASADNDRIQRHEYTELFTHIQNSGRLERYAQVIRELGKENHIPVADVYAAWEKLDDPDSYLINGLNHPDSRGHEIIADLILEETL
jgi:acyl-CoA thioesterase I